MHRRVFLANGIAAALAGAARAGSYARPAVSLARVPVHPGRPEALSILRDGLEPVSLEHYVGQVVVLNFWGPWCVPCQREMPSLSRLAAVRGLAVLPVAFDWRGASSVRRFYDRTGVDGLPILIGDGENLLESFGHEILPTTAILSPDGEHVFTVEGEASWDDPKTIRWLEGLIQA